MGDDGGMGILLELGLALALAFLATAGVVCLINGLLGFLSHLHWS
jgi:hypothetical protein